MNSRKLGYKSKKQIDNNRKKILNVFQVPTNLYSAASAQLPIEYIPK